MDKPGWKRLSLGLAALCAVLLVGLFLAHSVRNMRVAFAEDQTRTVNEMLDRSLQSTDPGEIAGYLRCTCDCYPSGTKQVRGSRLDRIVERHRSLAVAGIIEHLKVVTGEDLGPDPKPWTDRFAAE